MSGRRLGEILVEAGAIDEDQLRKALQHQKGKRLKLGDALIAQGLMTEEQVTYVRCCRLREADAGA